NALSKLLRSRQTLKNNAKNRIARSQKRGENRLSRTPPAIAASPVAFCSLMPLKIDQGPGTNSARNIAATPLRMPLTYSIAIARPADYIYQTVAQGPCDSVLQSPSPAIRS